MGLFLSIFFGFAPMLVFAWIVYWLDRYEKEPKGLVGGVFLWGAVAAAGGAFVVNTLLGLGVYFFTGSEQATALTTGALIAPIVEESLKGFAVLLVYLAFRREFDSVMDGIVYAAVVALGFAATENAYYIYTYGFQEESFSGLLWMVFVRVFLVGWQHPFYTAFMGIGLAFTRLSRNPAVRIFAPLLGFTLAVSTHSLHNLLAELLEGAGGIAVATLLDWVGWFIMVLIILWALRREQKWITQYLQEELALGLLSPAQYRTACSARAQSSARLEALFTGRYRSTDRFYHVCAELAHKKQQLATLGEESGGAIGNSAIIAQLRAHLSRLSPKAGP